MRIKNTIENAVVGRYQPISVDEGLAPLLVVSGLASAGSGLGFGVVGSGMCRSENKKYNHK